MTHNPVDWFEIYVSDLPRAKAFYEAVFATELERLDSTASDVTEVWALPMRHGAPGAQGALVKMEGGPAGGGAGTIVYFTCDDCSVQLERAEAHGGSLKKRKTSIGKHGFIALAQDTEGNIIGLHSMR